MEASTSGGPERTIFQSWHMTRNSIPLIISCLTLPFSHVCESLRQEKLNMNSLPPLCVIVSLRLGKTGTVEQQGINSFYAAWKRGKAASSQLIILICMSKWTGLSPG